MKIRLLSTTVPVMVVGGMILFLGCGAESKNAGRSENGSVASPSALADTPTTSNPNSAPSEGLPKTVTGPPKLSPEVDEIVQLAQSGVSDDVLQAYIENSPAAYKLKVDEILYLHDLGLPSETITAMVRHSQWLTDQSAALARANSQSSATNAMLPSNKPPEAEPAATTQNAIPESVPPALESTPGPANAYAITPPQQVNYNYFYQTLAPYGTWVEVPDHGWCWQPTVAVVDVSWRPYSNRGRWLWTDCGWYWQSDYSWGWAPFHYGRWYRSPRLGWVWAPDTVWGPAWVTWRYSDTYCGWAPLPPGAYFDVGGGFRFRGGYVNVGFDFGLVPDCYTFIPTAYFCDRTPWYYCLPRTHVVEVFKHTTIINNYIIGSNKGPIVHVGPGTNAIATVARHEIRKVALRDSNPADGALIKADRLERDGKTLTVFRPSLPHQAAAPPPEITHRQQELRKRSEFLANSEVLKRAAAANDRKTETTSAPRVSGETVFPSRGTPMAAPKTTGHLLDNPAGSPENSRAVDTGRARQAVEPPIRTPVISRNPRSERRNPNVTAASPVIARPFQTEPAQRSLAEVSPSASELPVPGQEERRTAYPPPQNPQPEFQRQPTYQPPIAPAERPQFGYPPAANPQVITPPVYRQEGRKLESPPASPFSPPPAYTPAAPTVVGPRAAEPGFSRPEYRPPQNISPPPNAAPRVIETPVARPSSPPPSYSPPPAVSHPQPAPSSAPSPSRSDGGRKP